MDGTRFTYQIHPRVLGFGTAALAGLLLLLALSAGPSPSWLWWLMSSVIMGLLLLTVLVGAATWRVGPIEVVLGDESISLPTGLMGTRRLALAFAEVKHLRAIGRATASRKATTREALYITYRDRYAVLMSDLFADEAAYRAFRDQLFAAVRRVRPEVRIDIDGQPLEASADEAAE